MNEIFKEEKLKDIWEEMLPIFHTHYKEIAYYQDIPLNPDRESYFKIEELGNIKTFTARENGELIGYSMYFIKHNLHYKDSLQALQDIIYIKKEKRGFGKTFIKWCDNRLREFGVQVVCHHVKVAHDWSKILENMGYEKQDILLTKRLDK